MIIIKFYNTTSIIKIDYNIVNLTDISNSLIIFSCFYDKRYKSIRIIGITSKQVVFTCKYYNDNKYKLCNYKYAYLNKDSSGYNYKSMYTNILIPLHDTSLPPNIILNNNVYEIINYNVNKKRNVLCITTFKNFVSYNLFLQSLEIYNIYGVTDVYIYTSDKAINFENYKHINYIHIHIIFIINEFYLNSTFYFGQTVKLNDCLYRNMYNTNYIIFADFDEVIILNKVQSYNTLFKTLKQGDIYYFRSAICPTTKFVEKKNFHIINDSYLYKTLNCCMLNSFSQRKYILKHPYKLVKINVHYIDYVYEKCKDIYVNETNAHIHHSRIPTHLLMNHCSKWFYDISLKEIMNFKHLQLYT